MPLLKILNVSERTWMSGVFIRNEFRRKAKFVANECIGRTFVSVPAVLFYLTPCICTVYFKRLTERLFYYVATENPQRIKDTVWHPCHPWQFLSTLAAYFLGQKELFKGLYLEKAEEDQAVQENRTAWETYPVLYLDSCGGFHTRRPRQRSAS